MTRATGPEDALGPVVPVAVKTVRIRIGDRVLPRSVLHGHYDFDQMVYRKWILQGLVRRYSMYVYKTDQDVGHLPRRALVEGHKHAIREAMEVVDRANEALITGVELRAGVLHGSVINQCYLGDGKRGSGVPAAQVYGRVTFLAEISCRNDPDRKNSVAFAPELWLPQSVLERGAAMMSTPDADVELLDTRKYADTPERRNRQPVPGVRFVEKPVTPWRP